MYLKLVRGRDGPEVGQSSRVTTRGCVPSSYERTRNLQDLGAAISRAEVAGHTIVSIRVLIYPPKKDTI